MNSNQVHNPIQGTPRGWHSRGYIPHFDAGSEHTQSITFRLGDAVPNHVVQRWNEELKQQSQAERELELRRLLDTYLDTGYGACHLRQPEIAMIVEGALLYFDSQRYSLHAWVVMPNHVHVLLTPESNWSLSKIVGSWKSYTSKEANKMIGTAGRFWQADYYDRFIRDEEHFHYVVNYIESNPVSAGLCARAEDWTFSSARRRSIGQ